MASAFGTTSSASSLVVAQTVPNLAQTLVSEEVGRGALLPVVAEHQARSATGRAEATTLAAGVWTTILMSVLAALVWVTASWSTKLLVPGGGHAAAVPGEAAHLLRLLVPLILTSGIGAASSAFLVAAGRVGAASMPVALSNLPLLALLVLAKPSIEEAALAIAAGAVLQITLQGAFATRARRVPLRASMLRWTSDLRIVLALAVPVAIALGASAFSGLVDTAFSTLVGAGGPAALDKAFRLVLVPYGMFAVGIGVVAMPALVGARLAGGHRFEDELVRTVRLQASMLVPAGVFIGLFAKSIVHLAYARGAFDAASTTLTTQALTGMAFVLPALGLSLIGSRAWLSQKRAWVPALAMGAGTILNGLLDWALVGPLGLFGIGIATAAVHASIGAALIATASSSIRRVISALAGFSARLASVAGAAALAVIAFRLTAPDVSVKNGAAAAISLIVLMTGARIARVDDYRELATALIHRNTG